MRKLPNCITGLRMAGGLLLAVFSPSAVPFWIVYLFTSKTYNADVRGIRRHK